MEGRSLDWDDKIPYNFLKNWICFFQELFAMESVSFKMSISFKTCISPPGAIDSPGLVMSSDASKQAFGACACIRWKL